MYPLFVREPWSLISAPQEAWGASPVNSVGVVGREEDGKARFAVKQTKTPTS